MANKRQQKPKKKKVSGEAAQQANRVILTRTIIVMVGCIVLFIPLIVTIYGLMVSEHEKYETMALANQTRSMSVSAERGIVYDRNMNIMATSTTVENVILDPLFIQDQEQDVTLIATGLSEILDIDAAYILSQAADTEKQYKNIKNKIPKEEADEVREFINENELKGVYLEPTSKRYYPNESLSAQVVGFVNSENVGGEGIEAYYDGILQGIGGKIITTKGNNGTEMLYTYEKYYDASNGDNLILTLDSTVQYFLEKNLQIATEKYDVLNGAFGIVMDVNTGEVIAMANMGSYDPNNYLEIYDTEKQLELENQYQMAMGLPDESAEQKEAFAAYNAAMSTARLRQWRNRCVSDGYEPGSTFKVITLAAALEEQAVDLTTSYSCGGAAQIPGRPQLLHCWKKEGHGTIDTWDALGGSCNIAFAHIGLALGGDALYDYIEAFGMLSQTGIDLPGEASGVFHEKKFLTDHANHGTAYLTSTAFGQTFKVTPIQLTRAIAAVVNGGYLMEPYIVDEITDGDGNVVQKTEPTVVRQVISQETSQLMQEMMEYVVVEGTASNAKTVGYRVGGKTGTSEKIDTFDENGVAVEDKIVSFVGVAPMNDPKYVVLVALDTPSTATGYYISGGITAAPTVRDVFSDILPYLGVEPDYNAENIELINVAVPNVTELTQAEAVNVLKEKSLTARVVGEGPTVTDQIPTVGMEVPGTSQIVIYMGEPKPTDRVEMPDFTGLSIAQANDLAAQSDLYLQTKGTSRDSSAVSVTYQDIQAGEMVDLGTTVTIELTDHSAQD